jgi:hypothetical protein
VTDYADLEIGLHAREGVTWRAELRFSQPRTDADIRLDAQGPVVRLDPDELRMLADDEEEYGRALGAALLGGPVGDGYRQARAAAQSQGITMRVRLLIGPSASRLHGLRWETMRDPEDGSLLLTDEAIVFSRYLSSLDWRPVGLRAKSGLRALVVVAGPTDVHEFGADRQLAPVDVAGEVARAREGLAPLPTQVLAEPGEATLDRLCDELRAGCDILYLVCHGYLAAGDEPILLLEDSDGCGTPVRAIDLVERMRDVNRMPRLVILASCQSSGVGQDACSEDGGVLAALGPRLAEAGVPAVVAMQGNVAVATVARFMPVFFRELQRDGQVDRAMAAARGAVRDRQDWWVPVLFMRLRTGRIWYASGFGRASDFEKFPALVNEIRKRRCTPVLGPGLNDQLLGSRQEIAQRWAKNFHFPMAPHARDDLPQVAQYLSVNQNREFPRDELGNYLRAALVADYGEDLPAEYSERSAEDIPLGPLMSHAWRTRYPRGSDDPYAVLAELPMSLYVITQPWNLLAEALRAVDKDPQVETCRWKRLDRDDPWGDEPVPDPADWAFRVADDPDERRRNEVAGWPTSVFDRERGYRPSAERPMVYHLFGHHARPRSLVLTEDDYFDFLIGVTRDKDLVPVGVRRAFADSSLMFLGFRLDEWDFRVLFRSIVNQEGDRRSEHTHVAVQIDPEEGRSMEPDRARRYLESYFQDSNVTIYWGSTESFLKELRDAWAREP